MDKTFVIKYHVRFIDLPGLWNKEIKVRFNVRNVNTLAGVPRYSNNLLLPYWAVLTTPLFFTRNAIIIAIHFGARTKPLG